MSKEHPADLHLAATNAANVAGAIASGQPFITDADGGVVLVSTYEEIVEAIDAAYEPTSADDLDAVSEPVAVVDAEGGVDTRKKPSAAKKRAKK